MFRYFNINNIFLTGIDALFFFHYYPKNILPRSHLTSEIVIVIKLARFRVQIILFIKKVWDMPKKRQLFSSSKLNFHICTYCTRK